MKKLFYKTKQARTMQIKDDSNNKERISKPGEGFIIKTKSFFNSTKTKAFNELPPKQYSV